MNYKTLFFKILIILFVFSCSRSFNRKAADYENVRKFWEMILEAMESKSIDFLIANSTDKVQCGNCRISSIISEWYNVEEIYNSHFEEIKPPIEQDYGISYDPNENNYKVSYLMKGDKKYNDFYVIVKDGEKLKFQGMFSVP